MWFSLCFACVVFKKLIDRMMKECVFIHPSKLTSPMPLIKCLWNDAATSANIKEESGLSSVCSRVSLYVHSVNYLNHILFAMLLPLFDLLSYELCQILSASLSAHCYFSSVTPKQPPSLGLKKDGGRPHTGCCSFSKVSDMMRD